MRFHDLHINREHRFALVRDRESDSYYFAIPVSNRLCDYEEYYAIQPAQCTLFMSDTDAALAFRAKAVAHELDSLLLIPPGSDRGVAG